MRVNQQNLYTIIQDFLSKKIDAKDFEKNYSQCYDFVEDLDLQCESTKVYYANIRMILERFTPHYIDLKEHPDFYIDEHRLQFEVFKITSDYNANFVQ